LSPVYAIARASSMRLPVRLRRSAQAACTGRTHGLRGRRGSKTQTMPLSPQATHVASSDGLRVQRMRRCLHATQASDARGAERPYCGGRDAFDDRTAPCSPDESAAESAPGEGRRIAGVTSIGDGVADEEAEMLPGEICDVRAVATEAHARDQGPTAWRSGSSQMPTRQPARASPLQARRSSRAPEDRERARTAPAAPTLREARAGSDAR